MKTVRIKVYEFNELNGDAKQKVLSHFSDINVNYQWWDWLYEDAETIGISIQGFDFDRGNIEGYLTRSLKESTTLVIKDHGVVTGTFLIAEKYAKMLDGASPETIEELEENYKSEMLDEYFKMLKNEFEYLTSDAQIIETIEANTYTFLASGEFFNK